MLERQVIDREELVEALAAPDTTEVPAPDGAGASAAVRGAVSAVVQEALGGNSHRPSRSPCRPLTAGQPCPEQPGQRTWTGPGCDQPGLSMTWLTVHREVFRHLVRGRLGAAAAAQVSGSGRGWSALPAASLATASMLQCRRFGREEYARSRCMAHRPRSPPDAPYSHAPTRQLARRGRLGCTRARRRNPGSRVLWNWTALTPETGPVAVPRTPLTGIVRHSSPGRILAFGSGYGSDSRLTAVPARRPLQ